MPRPPALDALMRSANWVPAVVGPGTVTGSRYPTAAIAASYRPAVRLRPPDWARAGACRSCWGGRLSRQRVLRRPPTRRPTGTLPGAARAEPRCRRSLASLEQDDHQDDDQEERAEADVHGSVTTLGRSGRKHTCSMTVPGRGPLLQRPMSSCEPIRSTTRHPTARGAGAGRRRAAWGAGANAASSIAVERALRRRGGCRPESPGDTACRRTGSALRERQGADRTACGRSSRTPPAR